MKRVAAARCPPQVPWTDVGGGVRVQRGVRLRLGRGVTLVSDHYYPPGWPGNGPAPTLLVRQPYGRAIATTVVYAQPEWFARQGFNVVIQDVRGRGDSDGTFYPFRHEGADGARTIEWLAKRPECNGRVGLYGFSYQGLTQLLAAAEQPEGLVCIAPAQTAGDLYHGWFYRNGALCLAATIGWAAQLLRADARRRRSRAAEETLEAAWRRLPELFAAAPYARIPELTRRGLPAYFTDWVAHREAGTYWAALDISTRHDRIAVPALHVAGWFDPYLAGSLDLFTRLRAEAATPAARAAQHLVCGPWVHLPWRRRAGDVDFGPEAELDTDALQVRWFRHWLQGDGSFDDEPPVRAFVPGENRWLALPGWPAGDAQSTWFLASGGRANSSAGDGKLAEAPAEGPPDAFCYEPEVPVLAPGPGGAPGVFDQSRAALLNNVLVYTSPPLLRPLAIGGTPRVTLFAQTSAPETDLAAKVVRVQPDGRAWNVSHGIARSGWLFRRTRHGADRVQEWTFNLEPACCVLGAGERLRLEVSSGAFPLYDRHPNTATPPHLAASRDWRPARTLVWHDAVRPSRLELPLLP
ncbi:MAG: CocE/NonD family hydrolase [Limisphaerales bacterium]